VRHGSGSVTFSDGAVLSATWVEGSLADDTTAIAALTMASGSVVEGGVWEGDVLVSGVERSDGPTAQVYTGGFDLAGLRTGQGTCTYRDGSSYVGEWRNGKRNGKGDFKDATTNGEQRRHNATQCITTARRAPPGMPSVTPSVRSAPSVP